jgi:hypothetical protein
MASGLVTPTQPYQIIYFQRIPIMGSSLSFHLSHNNRAEIWPLFLAYDAEICKRSTHLPIDPSKFSIGIWNNLETRFTANKVFSLVQADFKLHSGSSHASRDSSRNPTHSTSF